MSEYRKKLQDLLRELFQFDSADLDFGIYAVMNHKREQIERFIEHELLDAIESGLQVQSERQQLQARSDMEQAREALTAVTGSEAVDDSGQVIEAVKTATFPVVKQAVVAYEEARARFDTAALSTDLEAQTYNDLYRFFARYYDDGDFNSQRRYGGSNKYVVPYNGEEVLLHWANRDQYYVKTGEYFSDYRFAVEPAIGFGGASVHFKLRQASVEQNNVKGEKRFFVLAGDQPAQWDPAGRVLVTGFEYRPLASDEQLRAGNRDQQAKLNAEAEAAVLKALPDPLLREQLGKLRGEPGRERSLLAKHLARYTAHNTRDYFIHKNLGAFLRRELDFFLKNEVLRLEELDWSQPALVQVTAARVQTLQQIAGRIVDFLAQIEDFQRRLWEKRKFVVQSDWCVTLDRVPAALYGEIAANQRQRAEWQALYGVALGPDADLGQHPFLMVDTEQFERPFQYQLNITQQQVTDPRTVDLVTTFNFLLGLRVRTLRRFERPVQKSDFSEKSDFYRVVRVLGEDGAGRRACVLWRDAPPLAEMEAEKQWLQSHVLADVAYDLLYINGESALPDALPIEGEFQRLMFEGVS